MRYLLLTLMFISLSSHAETISRYTLNPWEADIGYSGAVQVGKQLYLSGIACTGKTMQEAANECYQQVQLALKHFNTNSSQIIKETVYTTDIEALIAAIPTRKKFFADGQYPAATWVQVARLYQKDHLLEVELIVQLP